MDTASEFSYCALVAMSLHRLYGSQQCDREYCRTLTTNLLHHRHQTKQVCDTILAMLGGIGADSGDPFVEILLNDPTLNCISVLFDLLALIIKDGCYDARSRVLLKRVAWYLRINWESVEHLEMTLAEDLKSHQHQISPEEEMEHRKQVRSRKVKRYALIGLATVGGGALIGLTGGLAAPLLAAGAGAVIGGAGAAAMGSVAGVAIIGSMFGVAGAGLTGYKMKRRVGATEEFQFELITRDDSAEQTYPRQLHITIAITGWLNKSMTVDEELEEAIADYILDDEATYDDSSSSEDDEEILPLAASCDAKTLKVEDGQCLSDEDVDDDTFEGGSCMAQFTQDQIQTISLNMTEMTAYEKI